MKKPIYKKLSCFILLLLASSFLFARSFSVDNINYNIVSDSTVSVGSSFYSGDISIPASVLINGKNYKVTSIANYAFQYCTGLTSIILPNTLTSIGESSFEYCRSLTNLTLPNSLTFIGDGAFYYCSGLTNITLSNSLKSIGDSGFDGCSGLTNIIIPNSVSKIGVNAFFDCSKLKSVIISNSVTTIDNGVFWNCTGLTSVLIPNSVKIIDTLAFYNCTSLPNIVIPSSVTNIEKGAFQSCKGLKSVSISDSLKYLGINAFAVSGLTSVVIPNSVTSIGSKAFDQCKELTSVIIPNSVTSIGFGAFRDCIKLKSVSFPNSLTRIEDAAFSGCYSLGSITLPNSLTYIGNGSFEVCTSLTSVILPNSVTNIGRDAFGGCSNLLNITLPSSLTSIGDYAFGGCRKLVYIYVNNSVPVVLESLTFYGGYYAILNVPKGTKDAYIDAQYWFGFRKIVERETFISNGLKFNITNSSTVELIANPTAYTGALIIPSSLEYNQNTYNVNRIADSAFFNCTGLTSIFIPKSVTNIGNGAFKGCNSLNSITVESSSPLSVSSGAFERLANLNEVFASSVFSSAILYVPIGSKTAYQNDVVWGRFVNIIEFSPTWVEKVFKLNYSIFPNPAKDNVTITTAESVLGTISIIDLNGNVVARKSFVGNAENISTSDLASGVYIVKIESDKVIAVRQLVVQ